MGTRCHNFEESFKDKERTIKRRTRRSYSEAVEKVGAPEVAEAKSETPLQTPAEISETRTWRRGKPKDNSKPDSELPEEESPRSEKHIGTEILRPEEKEIKDAVPVEEDISKTQKLISEPKAPAEIITDKKSEDKVVPWTEEKVKLRKTPKEKKQVQEDKLEEITLKPRKKIVDTVEDKTLSSSEEEEELISEGYKRKSIKRKEESQRSLRLMIKRLNKKNQISNRYPRKLLMFLKLL